MTDTLLVATNNAGKLREIQQILGAFYARVVSFQDINLSLTTLEDGDTFEQNALKKAREASQASGLPALADDSGLAVDALDGAPGVFSARYAGENSTDQENIDKLLAALQRVPAKRRTARFVCTIALVYPDGRELTTTGVAEGVILKTPRGHDGFGYDPIFYDPQRKLTFAQMSAEQKNAVSHRAAALSAMTQLLREASKNDKIFRLAVVSDTHGYPERAANMIHSLLPLDALIHLGDHDTDTPAFRKVFSGDMYVLRGNNDVTSAAPDTLTLTLGGVTLVAVHGHLQAVGMSLTRLALLAEEQQASLALFGHTHRSLADQHNGILFVNPGSAYRGRLGHPPSIALIEIQNGRLRPHIITLERRS